MSRRLLAVPVIALLAACTAVPPAPVAPVATGPCNAELAMAHVGHEATDAMVEAARRDASAALSRKISPGQAVTMDFRADRLDVHVDADNVITRVTCG